ncbi:hypothetical protein BC835DRAFT_1422413 [Cytidiella melzeri]|nr:hypothetical protein BC835DRAFT_1422413 [Cytidiella melzeri]
MHSLHQALIFAILALSLFQVDASAVKARYGSNADRLARGLPPAHPKRLFHPDMNVARDVNPSATVTDSDTASSTGTSSADSTSSSTSITDSSTAASSSESTSSSASATFTSSSSDSLSSAASTTSSSSSTSSDISTSTSSSATPTPTTAAPGTVVSGYVGIYSASTGAFIGNVGAYGYAAGAGWTYSYTVPATPGTPVELNYAPTPYRLSPVAIRSDTQPQFGPGNTYHAEAQNSRASTPAYSSTSTYVYDTYAIGYTQTTVWVIDPYTGLVTCQWVNSDGSTPTMYFVANGGILYITGDVNALETQLGTSDLTPVNVYFGTVAQA